MATSWCETDGKSTGELHAMVKVNAVIANACASTYIQYNARISACEIVGRKRRNVVKYERGGEEERVEERCICASHHSQAIQSGKDPCVFP
ncbi:hypothetical protein EVAR_54064_1 [Eumeta japonica]|uniref:Uncharacterized protein n=1 Tax=Eumeta variegata TaxID=151549 RepID=A0A4C1XIC0_EUMVA|nr:hypothetical protein EVAR_54064_1 [Eumeta japonica]